MKTRLLGIAAATAMGLALASTPAHAANISLDFNSLASGASSSQIQTYIQGVLGGWGTVSVTSGAVTTDRTYNGDGHVVGPTDASGIAQPVTLGSSDGAGIQYSNSTMTNSYAAGTTTSTSTDTFLRNVSGITGWSFNFSNNIAITSVSFDWEIFPDGSCLVLNSTNCGYNSTSGLYANLPDFTFSTNLSTSYTYYSKTPGAAGGSIYTESPCTDSNGITPYSSTQCPAASNVSGKEATPQLIGHSTFTNLGGAKTLTFMDWPATIGIDNLQITFTPVPEPGTMLLLGTGVATVIARRRRKQNK